MARWIDLDAVMEKLAACGNDSDRNFRAECISAPYFPQEVAPVHLGSWQKNGGVFVPDKNGVYCHYTEWHCSECGFMYSSNPDSKKDPLSFCPNCGAKMIHTETSGDENG